tara:strand:- start:9485 stop:11044 length:1560 start_codon:yes stop_codon:yes gene_type:complete
MNPVLLLLCCLFWVSAELLPAQSNPGLQEYERRQQEAALQRARQLKAAKDAAVQIGRQESASLPQVSANPASRNQAAPPPPQFRLVTSTGAVVNWTPGTPMPVNQPKETAAPRREPREQETADKPQLRTIRFSLGRASKPEEGEEANVERLDNTPDSEPVADVGPAEEGEEPVSEARFPWRTKKAPEPNEEQEAEEMVAILEEIPSKDGKPARTRMLGVLLRGQAAKANPEVEAVASVEENLDEKKNEALLVSYNQEPAEMPKETEESAEAAEDPEPEEKADETSSSPKYAFRGLRSLFEPPSAETEVEENEELITEEEAPVELASIEPADNRKWKKWLSFQQRPEPTEVAAIDDESMEEEDKKEQVVPDGPVDPNYFTIDVSSAPFHVIDSGPEDTFVVELGQGAVGRTHGSGENWTWLEMHDGLMGLMRKKHLRPARQSEVMNFLAMESGSGVGSREPVQFVEIDLPELPEEVSDAGMFLGEGLLPSLSETTSEPMEVTAAEESEQPVTEKAAEPLE